MEKVSENSMDMPQSVRLETCNICQLKCPLCQTPSRKKKPGDVGWGYLQFEKFKDFLDRNPFVKTVELAWLGEIFLNPDLQKIIRYAFNKGVILKANGGTNFNSVSAELLIDLVKYKFASLTIAIDGACQKTYVKYRQGGDFTKVIRNIMLINRYKREYRSQFPILTWQFIIFGHNQHEISMARQLARKLGMRFSTKMSWDKNYSPISDKRHVRAMTGAEFTSREDFTLQYGKDYMDHVCRQLWEEPVISWNGNVFGCCKNTRMSLGNVFDLGLKAVLNGSKYRYMQEVILGKKSPQEDFVCKKCPVYMNRVRLDQSSLQHEQR